MKKLKLSVFIFFLAFLANPVYSQIMIGAKAGFQMSRVEYKDKEYSQTVKTLFKPGYNAGLVLNYRVNQTFSLHTELFYSRKGKTEKLEESILKNVAAYHYIDLPLLLRVSKHKKIRKQNVDFYFNIGPNFSYWMGGRGKLTAYELKENLDTETIKYTIKYGETGEYGETLYIKDANRLQVELNLGGGAIFDMSRGQKLMVDLRYGFGVGQTFLGKKDSGNFGIYEYNDNFEAVNHVLSVSVAYLFEINVNAVLKKGKSTKKGKTQR